MPRLGSILLSDKRSKLLVSLIFDRVVNFLAMTGASYHFVATVCYVRQVIVGFLLEICCNGVRLKASARMIVSVGNPVCLLLANYGEVILGVVNCDVVIVGVRVVIASAGSSDVYSLTVGIACCSGQVIGEFP